MLIYSLYTTYIIVLPDLNTFKLNHIWKEEIFDKNNLLLKLIKNI